MSAKYILMDRKMTELQKEIGKLQIVKWVLLFISIPTMVLFPLGVITFFVCGSKQKKLQKVVDGLELDMASA